MVDKKLNIGLLFPFRKDHEPLNQLSRDFPVEIIQAPYIESNELRSSRGLNSGRNPHRYEEPSIEQFTLDQWRKCNAIISMDLPSNPEILFPNLQWFQGVSAGYDHIDTDALTQMGVIQTSARGIASSSIAEFVFARLLQIWKELRILDQQQDERTWRVRFGTEANGKTIGIVGFGSIGKEVAIRARAFGMTVLATRRSLPKERTDVDADFLFPADEVDKMIAMSDVVVMAAPATEETRDMFNKKRFALMKPKTIFCNIARGMHVVEDDLVEALNNGHLAAAILDVVRTEPLPEESPIWSATNMYLSPHCSVSFDSYEENAVALLVENAKRFLQGTPLANVVNRAS